MLLRIGGYVEQLDALDPGIVSGPSADRFGWSGMLWWPSMMLGNNVGVLRAQVQLEYRLAALRTVETLRIHAAASGDQLPERLDDVTVVPVPLNPVTGKPFAYRLEAKTAVVGEVSSAEKAASIAPAVYRATIRPPE